MSEEVLLQGPHQTALRLQRALREEHGHSHGHEDAELRDDPSLLQCCIKDRELQRKGALTMQALRAEDPVAAVERDRTREVSVSESELSPADALRRFLRKFEQGNAVNSCSRSSTELEQFEDVEDEVDAELEALLDEMEEDELVRKFTEARMSETKVQIVNECSSVEDLAKWMVANREAEVKMVHVRNQRAALSSKLAEVMQEMGNCGAKFAVIDDEVLKVTTNPILDAFKGKGIEETPCVLCFDASSHPLGVISMRLLEKDQQAVADMISKSSVKNGASSTSALKHDAYSGEEEEEEETQFCNRPGCEKKFIHEHVQKGTVFE